MKVKDLVLAAGLAMVGLIAPLAQAVPVNFQGGVILALPCSVNNGEVIEVDFGDMVIREIDGVRYSKPIPFKIDCSAAGAVQMRFTGTKSSFDLWGIETSKPGLGIHITIDGNPYPAWAGSNKDIPDVQSPPELRAVPIVNSASPPSPGAFTSVATLLAEYQ